MKEGVEFSDIWRVESFPVKLWKYFPPGGSGTQVKLDKYFKTLYSRIEKFWFLNLFHYIPFLYIKLLKLTIFELLVPVGWYVINVTLLQTLLTIIANHLFWHFTTAFLKKILFLQIYCWKFFIDPQNCFWAWTIELVVFTFVWTKITGHLWGNNWGPPHN